MISNSLRYTLLPYFFALAIITGCIQSEVEHADAPENSNIPGDVIKNDFEDKEYWVPDWLKSSPGFYNNYINEPRFSSSGKWAFVWKPSRSVDSLFLFNLESKEVYVPLTNPNPNIVAYNFFEWSGENKIFYMSVLMEAEERAYHILDVSSIMEGQADAYQEKILDLELPDFGYVNGLKTISPSGKWLAINSPRAGPDGTDTLFLINLTNSEKIVAHINYPGVSPHWYTSFSSTWIGENQIFICAEEEGRVRAAKLDVSSITQNFGNSQGLVSEFWIPEYAGEGFAHLIILSPSGKWLRYFTYNSDNSLELLKIGTQQIYTVNPLNPSNTYVNWENLWIDDARIPYVIINFNRDPEIFVNEFRILNLSYITAHN